MPLAALPPICGSTGPCARGRSFRVARRLSVVVLALALALRPCQAGAGRPAWSASATRLLLGRLGTLRARRPLASPLRVRRRPLHLRLLRLRRLRHHGHRVLRRHFRGRLWSRWRHLPILRAQVQPALQLPRVGRDRGRRQMFGQAFRWLCAGMHRRWRPRSAGRGCSRCAPLRPVRPGPLLCRL